MPDSKGFLGKAVSALFLFAVLMWIVNDPATASQFFNHLIAFVQRVLTGLIGFLSRITNS